MLPEADRWQREVAVGNRPVVTLLILPIDSRKVAGIVLDKLTSLRTTSSWAEYVVPIVQVKQPNRLESTILRSLSGQAPDPYWIGNVDAETFANLVSDLFLLLAEPDRQGVLALADHLAGEDWWDKHRLGYGVVTTLASLQHWASR
jgi:hypothetical protein